MFRAVKQMCTPWRDSVYAATPLMVVWDLKYQNVKLWYARCLDVSYMYASTLLCDFLFNKFDELTVA
jgi:hypothetical protein